MKGTLDLDGFEAAKRMAAMSPETQGVFEDRMSCGWEGQEKVIQGFDAIGSAIASNRRPISDANKKKIFAFAEQLLRNGSDQVSNAVATRLLERVWSAAHGSGFDFSSVDPHLGPQSRAYVAALDDFHHTKTEGLSRRCGFGAGRKMRRSRLMVWTPEPTYEKPDISVRATTLYYQIAAPILLPFAERRLLNLFRCREGKCFFQRNREHPPTGKEFDRLVHFQAVEQKNGRTEQYLYVESGDEIVACAKVQTVEFHGWGSRAGEVETPDRLVIDLDPGEGVGFDAVKNAALQLKRSFDALGLASSALLTGGKGIHVVVPLVPVAEWDEVREFAKAFCTSLAEADPRRFTVALPKKQRRGRIFLDFLRNQRTATAILPYSARARSGMPVAAPVGWDELEEIERSDAFTIADVEALLKRAKSRKLKGWGEAAQPLPRIG